MQEEDLALAHLIIHEMNLLLLSEPSLHVLRALLPKWSNVKPVKSNAADGGLKGMWRGVWAPPPPRDNRAHTAFFLRLYRPWCVHPAVHPKPLPPSLHTLHPLFSRSLALSHIVGNSDVWSRDSEPCRPRWRSVWSLGSFPSRAASSNRCHTYIER